MADRWYLLLGNLWLLAALVLYLGRVAVRYQPTRYSFFGIGGWLSPFAYGLLIAACIIIGLAFIFRRSRVLGTSKPG